MKNTKPLTVYFNGACSLCGPEVAVYQRMVQEHAIEQVAFQDISSGRLPKGYSRETLLSSIHTHEGEAMLQGVEAFIALWLRLPKFKYLAYLINWPILRSGIGLIYNHIIAPWLYKRYLRQTCDI
jgi:predicted DCC family thiol-disulfide oxidoreductase YuxK